jgi:hypothetical protein
MRRILALLVGPLILGLTFVKLSSFEGAICHVHDRQAAENR